MNLEEVQQLEQEYVLPTFARKPVMLVEGQGMRVKDDQGKEYLDFIAGIGVNCLGHCHPAVVNAVSKQAAKLMHVSNYYYIEKRAEVAKLISDMLNEQVPSFFRAPWKTFFANSGAEANECAIKMARLYARKNAEEQKMDENPYVVITLDGSFHGRTLATLAATAQPAKQEAFHPLPAGFVSVPPNDLDALAECLYDQANLGKVCAFMFEPIQGESGVHPLDPDYLFRACKLARSHGALIIADEVQAGIYRTGENPFAFQNKGITPDIITMAKGIAGGFPMGACAVRLEVAEAMQPGDHGSTFGGSNLAMAAAYATLTTLQDEGIPNRVAAMGEYFKEKLAGVKGVTEVRGEGLMLAVDLEEGIDAHEVVFVGLERGFLLNATGHSTLRFLPPLIITRADIDELIEALPDMIEAGREPEYL